MRYLTYDEYKETGGVLSEKVFLRNIDRASGIISAHTFGRTDKMENIPNELKLLCRDLTEYLAANRNDGEKQAISIKESAGTVSESISYEVKTASEAEKDIDDMVYFFLAGIKTENGIPVLYRGYAE